MKQPRLLPALLLALLMLLPAGCGTQTTGAPQQTPTPTETATVSGAAGTLRVQVPDGWKYEICPEGTLDGSGTDFGVKIRPDSGSDSCVQLYWSDSFGVCGTGLKEESLTLAGDSVSAGYYDGDKNWTFLSYQGKTAASLPGPTRTLRGSRRRVSRCSPCSTRSNGNRQHNVNSERTARPAAELCCGAIFVICYFAAAGTAAGSAVSAASASGCAAAKPCTRPCSRIYLRFLYTPTVRNGTTTTAMPR